MRPKAALDGVQHVESQKFAGPSGHVVANSPRARYFMSYVPNDRADSATGGFLN